MLLHLGQGTIRSGFIGDFSCDISLCSSILWEFSSEVSVSDEGVFGFSTRLEDVWDFESSVVWNEASSSWIDVSSFLDVSCNWYIAVRLNKIRATQLYWFMNWHYKAKLWSIDIDTGSNTTLPPILIWELREILNVSTCISVVSDIKHTFNLNCWCYIRHGLTDLFDVT